MKTNQEFWGEFERMVEKRIGARADAVGNGADFFTSVAEILRDGDREARLGALQRLRRLMPGSRQPHYAAIVAAVTGLLAGGDTEIRLGAIRALAAMGAQAVQSAEGQELLLRATEDGDAEIRLWAIVALGPVADRPAVLPGLKRLASDDADAAVRAEAEGLLRERFAERVQLSLDEALREEPAQTWFPPLALDALAQRLDESRRQPGHRIAVAGWQEAERTVEVECVSGVVYLAYETPEEGEWSQFLLAGLWEQTETDAPRCLTTTAAVPDGIHWLRVALLAESETTGQRYGFRLALPLHSAPIGRALLTLSQPFDADCPFLPALPDSAALWHDPLPAPALAPGNLMAVATDMTEAFRRLVVARDESGSVLAELGEEADGELALRAQCLSVAGARRQVTFHVAFGEQNPRLWQATHIFQHAGETVQWHVRRPADQGDARSFVSISMGQEAER